MKLVQPEWTRGLENVRNLYKAEGFGHDVFVPHKNLSLSYLSPEGSHFGIYFDPASGAAVAGVDQAHIFGTRWNIIAGSPLRVMLYNEKKGVVALTGRSAGESRELDHYPHMVTARMKSGPCRAEQVVAFVDTDRLLIRLDLELPDPGSWRLLVMGGRGSATCRIAKDNRAVSMTYPVPRRSPESCVPPVTFHVLFPAVGLKMVPVSEDALRSLADIGASGRSTPFILRKFISAAGWITRLNDAPTGCYFGVSEPLSARGGKVGSLDFVVQLQYEKKATEPAAPRVDSEIRAAAQRWRNRFGKLRMPRSLPEGEKELLRKAVITLENQQWKPVHEYGTYSTTFPSKGWYNAAWLWDSCFHALGYLEYDTAKAAEEILLLARFQDPKDGRIPIEMHEYDRAGSGRDYHPSDLERSLYMTSQPPLLGWVGWRLHGRHTDRATLRKFYGACRELVRFWDGKRMLRNLRLYHWDSEDLKVIGPSHESGWDNSPKYDRDGNRWAAVDLNCYMVNLFDSLAKMAGALGRPTEGARWQARSRELAGDINEKLFSEELQCYVERHDDTDEFSDVLAPTMFHTMWAGVATQERAGGMVKRYLLSRKHFWPLVPTVSYSHRTYNPEFYWRGPMWLNIAYFTMCGLHRYGMDSCTEDLRKNLLAVVAKNGHFAEYYNSRTGEGLARIPYSWTAAVTIKIILREYSVLE